MVFELLFFMLTGCDPTLSTQFKMLRGHGQNYTIEDIPWAEDLEYPGKNPRLLTLVRQKWEQYYICLLMKHNQGRRPEIIRLIEGQYVELECDICPRPFQNYEEIEWKYKPLSPTKEITELQHLDLAQEMTLTETKTIRIFNALECLSGLYVCYNKLNEVSVYILEVSKNDTMQKIDTFRSKPIITSKGKNFEISYRWSGWTECNACGRVGKKYKYGTCYVTPKNKYKIHKSGKHRNFKLRKCWSDKRGNHSCRAEITAKKHLFKKLTKEMNNSTSESVAHPERDLDITERFSTGIPCASQYLPKSILGKVDKLPAIKVIVKFCWEPCRETEIFEVFDDRGYLVEWANNTAGIYSLFQEKPPLPHDIERRTISAAFGEDIVIQCPGTTLTNTPVVWKLDNRIVFPDIIANESNGRFTIDWINRINLRKLRLKDSRIYSCWQKDKLVGTVHLNVEKKFKIRLDHHVTLVVIAVAIGMLLLVGRKMIARELRLR